MTEQAASRAAIAVLLVLVLLLVSPPVGAQLLRQEFRGSPVVVAAAPSCCKGCSYGEAGCCCAPNDARPLRVTVTVPPKPISRTLFVTRFRTATVTLGKAATRGKANLKSSNEEDLELGSQPKQPEPAQRQLPQEGPKFLGVQPEDVPNGEDEDEGDKPSTDEQDNESTHELFARHICPRCPKGARILSLSSGRAANGLPICCPPRKTVTRTMTRGTIRIVWKTSTRYLTRTSTRTASSVRKTSSKTKTLTRTTLDPLRWITKLEGTLFNDINGNGIQDPNEPGTGNALLSLWSLVVARARVQGRSPNTLLNRTTTTSGTGYFLFTFEPILVGTPLRISKKEGAVEHPLAEVTATPATQALNLTVADLAINGSSSTTTVQAGGAKSTTSRTVAGGGQSMSLSSTSTTRESTTLKTSETETPRTSETTTSQTSETVSPQSSSTSLTDAPTPTTTRVPTTTSSISKSPSSSTTLAVGVSIAGLSTSATAAGTTTLSQTSSSFTESYSTSESLTSSTETLSSTSFTESSTSASLTTSSRTQSLTSSTSSKSQSSSSLSRTRTSSTLSETLTSTTGPTSSTTESETTTSETETTSESETTSSETPVTTSSTRTTNTRTTSLTKTSSTSETETTTTSRTLYTVDPSYVPVVNPGSVGAIAWRTDWGDIELGNPVGTIQLVCVNVDEPCTATPVATSGDPVPLDQVNTLIVIGLAQNTNYTCYGIVTYETGPVCTSGTLVTVGPGILLSIWHPDGRRWTFNDDERYIGLEQTANFSLRTYAQRDVSINWNENYIQFFESDRSAWLRGRYQDVLDLNPGSADEAFQIWKNPTGGYALWSSRQYFVGYNNDSDWVMDGPGENWVFPIFNWTIVPDPSEGLAELPGAYYAGVLTAPKIPPATYGTFEYSMFIASIVNPGGSSGAPTGRYKVRCVYLDESCTAYPRWETPFYAANSVESVSGITGAWVGGLDPGQTYSCYSVADNYYAEVCSSSADISIPAVENATLYSFAHPSGLVWRWYQGPTDQHPWLRLSQGTAGVQFVMYKPYPDENWCRMWSPNTGSSMHAFFAYWDGPKFSIRDTPTGYNGRLRFWRKSPNHFAIQIQDWSAYLSYYNNTGEDDFITLTNYGGSTFVSDWIITPEPELCIAGNFTVAAPPSMPDVGSWYANMWTTTWTFTDAGLPEATFTIICVPVGQPCNSTPVVSCSYSRTSTDPQDCTFGGFPTNGTSLDCYVTATNFMGTVCSTKPRTVTPPSLSGTTYTITRLNDSAPLLYNQTRKRFAFVGPGVSFTYVLYNCSSYSSSNCPTSNNNWTRIIANRTDGINDLFWSDGTIQLNTLPWYGVRFWNSPSGGGYAIQAQAWMAFVSYDVGGKYLYLADTTYQNLVYWNITPAPPAAKIAGTLTLPSATSQPGIGSVFSYNSWSTSWTYGASNGSPTAQFYVRCVPQGVACTNTTQRWESGVVSPPTASTTVSGLTVSKIYTCYVIGRSVAGDVCSPSTTLVVP